MGEALIPLNRASEVHPTVCQRWVFWVNVCVILFYSGTTMFLFLVDHMFNF